ncbi:hypothetical protein A2865_03330 [Candidatus Woesebacteria bacterium RIFCSPHIGHO2_01_FULL_39_17]|uniref:Membrane protein 6-pyruvoyl-tetrahydropterin synthase-related domain-containing protein n=3 Tax=Candidatus Woeseibacteriota TaxID=1752722 RepID=A0A0G0N8D9_9BACT|nr:MAG: hypothetical protein US72_C0010G0044 [Microgenomates group bacterium GW2011_GWC1_38_12]KKQ94060.1 MAG: hypothetical protein UT19_C0004G0021 [Candidatus Woesebacteria bacterium GW2011_GWB1_39_10b]KKR12449.1 MAG: hypothetical protein UT40_C0026G0010 [Candidatus Woesebacteria bacterium GW2011_GWA1_39_21b]OGM24361.1 MAG: hypothetical protein A2865_03330 [Candidatus Woesebacteria bacterium RIFCSPHIGHO2_01_FULL_39_17]OGM61095.1 MAG: hypothetical protein A3A52_04870 [Candidatus Woesebacteria b
MTKIKIFFKKNFLFVLLLILIIPTFQALIRPGYFPMHDDMQAMRLLQMDKCVKDRQIPCRWVPDMGFGYGYPQFNYYAPLPYYIMEIIHLLGFGFLDSVKAGFILSMITGAMGMYLLGSSLWGKAGGFISALIYTYAPYRAVDVFVRGAMGEVWAFALLPFVFWSVGKVFKGKKISVLYLALSFSALLTSHNISAILIIPFLLAWILLISFRNFKESPTQFMQRIYRISIGFVWGIGIASFFILPAWFEKNLVHVETLLSGYFNYINHFVSLNQLLFQTQWGYGTSEVGPYDDLLLSVGLILWVLPLISLVLNLYLKKKPSSLFVFLLILFGWFSLFMAHSKSSFFWNNIKILSFVQFPWRFLLFSTFFFSLAAGSIALAFKKGNKLGGVWMSFLIILLFFLYRNYFIPRIWINTTDQEKFSGESWQRQQTISIFDYLPVYAKMPPAAKASDEPVFISGEGDIKSGQGGSNWQNWEVEVLTEKATLQFGIFYFPLWTVRVGDKLIPINYDDDLGAIKVDLNRGGQKVMLRLTNTPVRSFSNIVTLVSIFFIPIFLRKKELIK